MSAHVSVHPYPHRVAVICPQCDIDQEYENYREALDRCKEHNLYLHPEAIQWAN